MLDFFGRFAMGARGKREKTIKFVNKVPFDFSEELIECILLTRQGREYATTVRK